MSRRANGEGTIYQRRDGRWEGAAYVLMPNGGYARRRVYGRTRAEVAGKLTELVHQSQRGVPAPTVGLTVAAFLTEWLAQVATNKVRPATLRGYEAVIRVHLIPGLGRKKLHRLSPSDVRRFLAERRSAGLSATTVKQLHAVLRSALSHAVREDLIPRNVARLVMVPTPGSAELRPLDVDEARRLLDAARGDRLFALWAVALALGLRRGEALGLRWCDLDLAAGLLQVRQTLQRAGGRLAGTPLEPRNANRASELLERAQLRHIRLHD